VVEILLPETGGAFDAPHGTRLTIEDGVEAVVVRSDAVFYASVVSFGCLGVVYAVTVEARDAYWLHETRLVESWSDHKDHIDQTARTHRHVEVQISPHARDPDAAEPDHDVQVVRRRIATTHNRRGRRAAILKLASTKLAPGVLGDQVKAMIREPHTKPRDLKARGLRCTAQPTDEGYRAPADDVLLLNLRYESLGAEYAVRIEHAAAAANLLLARSRQRDERAAALFTAGKSAFDDDTFDTLLAYLEEGPPFGIVVTMRFATSDRCLLSMTHGPDLDALWCILEVGWFDVPDLADALHGGGNSKMQRAYRAYDKGRRKLFREIEEALRDEFGARPHWGLHNHTTQATARELWGEAWDTLMDRYLECNVDGIFDNRYTDQLGISRRPGAHHS
jgi:hypothetical protein